MSAGQYSEWIDKAEEDFRVASRENRHKKYPAHNTVCFNAQQCSEKYLMAFLVRHGHSFPKTHDLADLQQRCESIDPAFSILTNHLNRLFRYGVERFAILDSTLMRVTPNSQFRMRARSVNSFANAQD